MLKVLKMLEFLFVRSLGTLLYVFLHKFHNLTVSESNSCARRSLCIDVVALVLLTPHPPPSVWPHLFCGAGHEKRRGEQP